MALSRAVSIESSINNCFSFSSVSGDATSCDQQYTKLKTFLAEAVEPYKEELNTVLYPLFVHLYLELLCNGHKTPAHKFYSRHHAAFKECDQAQDNILHELQQMFSKDDVVISKEVNEFREHRYAVNISEDAFQYVFRYLKGEESILLLQVFNKHFDFQVGQKNSIHDTQQNNDKSCDQMAPASPPCTPENKVIHNEHTLSSLQQCIKKVRSGPPCLPSVCMYSISNTPHSISCADLSNSKSLLVSGSEDSTIHLWSLTPDKLSPEAVSAVDVSHIHLFGDHQQDILNQHSMYSKVPKEMITMRGHSGAVYGTCFTSDNQFVISVSEDMSARLWDLKTHTCKVVYRGHNYPVWCVDTSPVGAYFVTGSHDRTAKLWTSDRIYPLRTFLGHMTDVDVVKFHPNCNYIATGSSDRVVRLWSVLDGQPVRLFQGHKAGVYALAFSSDGKLLASSGEDRRIKIWDLSAGTLYKDLRGHTDTVYSLSFNPENTVLASGGLDGTLRLWNIEASSSSTSPSGSTSAAAAASGGGGGANVNQETVSPEQMTSFAVRQTTLHRLHYTKHNLLLAVGAPSI